MTVIKRAASSKRGPWTTENPFVGRPLPLNGEQWLKALRHFFDLVAAFVRYTQLDEFQREFVEILEERLLDLPLFSFPLTGPATNLRSTEMPHGRFQQITQC
jgi:hypothetical protein